MLAEAVIPGHGARRLRPHRQRDLDFGEGTDARPGRVQHHALGGGELGQDAGHANSPPNGITVNNVLPGSTETPRIEQIIEQHARSKTGRSREEVYAEDGRRDADGPLREARGDRRGDRLPVLARGRRTSPASTCRSMAAARARCDRPDQDRLPMNAVSPSERRDADRVPYASRVMIVRGESAWFAQLLDLSEGGCGVFRPDGCTLAADEVVRLFFYQDDATTAVIVPARVARVADGQIGWNTTSRRSVPPSRPAE